MGDDAIAENPEPGRVLIEVKAHVKPEKISQKNRP